MGLIRLVQIAIVGFLIWFGYKAFKRYLAGGAEAQARKKRQAQGEVMDVMVQDPQCGTYLPKHEAKSAWVDGQERFFCSKKCRDAYVDAKRKGA
ncbi:MAG: hypothetical protein KQH53_07640 [Desulfarculaceae bacterium]|nr:hypothetical protein [Desulfarculaceae bacterium]